MDINEFSHHIWELFRSLSQGIDSTLRVVIESYGITMTQMRILVELKHCGECTVGELGMAIGSAPGNSSAMCKTLEKKGLVSRTRSPEDERIVLISMTDRGRSLLQQINEKLSVTCNPVLRGYTPADYELIFSGMGKLKEIVTNLHDTFDASQARR